MDVKAIGPVAIVAFAGVFAIMFVFLGLLTAAGFASFGNQGGSPQQAAGGDFVELGDVEFVVTYYDPGQGGINGTNCGGAYGDMCLAPGGSNSPTGYIVTEHRTNRKFTGGAAHPQPTSEGGSVDVKKIPLYYSPSKGTNGKAIVIPCYNDDQPFLPVDRFATSVTAPNALDLVMTGAANSRFVDCLRKRKIKTSPASNGHGSATRMKGKIVELPGR